MASDRSLAALLRAFRSPSEGPDAGRLLGSATGLLVLLSNPLNVTLLTSQLLTAPAIWHRAPTLRTAFQLIGAFNTASAHLAQRGHEQDGDVPLHEPEGLPIEEWVKCVVKGADDKSPRWKHLLVLGGILTGFEKHERRLPPSLRQNLETAIVTATNLALEDPAHSGEESLHVVCFVLGHVFDLLSEFEKSRLNHERLLSVLLEAIFFSRDGFHWGYFLGTMDADLLQVPGSKFSWSLKSSTYFQTQRIASSPLIGALGTLSRIASYCVSFVSLGLVYQTGDSLQSFSRSVSVQWQQNKLSEVDPSEEALFLDEETRARTIPTLWQLLKSSLFATVIIQSALLGRMISDVVLPQQRQLALATQLLHTLRNLYFITVRLGQQLFSQHTFVYMGAIDILSTSPFQAESFLQSIRPSDFGSIPTHPYSRLLDLFFLNTAEHFTLALTLETNQSLLLGAAAAYTGTGHDPRLLDIFEAAHSVTLAVFSAPQNYALTIAAIPEYIDTLFNVFPHSLSARQFRLAVKTLVKITSSPGPILAAQPSLAPTIMELVFSRALSASDSPLSALPQQAFQADADQPMSEKSALVLTLIDALPSLALITLEEWLPLTADAMNAILDEAFKAACRHRFWEVLQNGEMDIARAQLGVMWWTTQGGREMVLYGQPSGIRHDDQGDVAALDPPLMSGALPDAREEKL